MTVLAHPEKAHSQRSTPTPPEAPALGGRIDSERIASLRERLRRPEAMAELRRYLRGTLARILRSRSDVQESDIDDLEQDAFVRILDRLHGFRGDSRFTTWATAVAIRVALGALRRRRPPCLPESAMEGTDAGHTTGSHDLAQDPARAITRRSLLTTLDDAIRDSLTERQRSAIRGRLAGVCSAELAERLDTSSNALNKLSYDARQKLKSAINEAGFSDADVREELQTFTGTA